MPRLDDLHTLRSLLLSTLGEVSPDKRAAVSLELRRTIAEIDELEAATGEQKGSVLDELTARRAARRTGTAG